jgi:uncharacterized damage-inducible protein DinB
MSEIERIKDQLHRSFYGNSWHGPAVMEVLKGMDAKQAAHRPMENVHSIWEITQHISAWEEVVLKRLQGDRTPVTAAIGWERVNKTSEAAWQRMLELLENRHIELEQAVEKLPEDRLDEKIIGENTFYLLLHGVVQHDLFHAGQIAILKKCPAEETKPVQEEKPAAEEKPPEEEKPPGEGEPSGGETASG